VANEHILIVDDDHDLVDVLKMAIEPAGYRVSVAYNGEQAWQTAQESTPDLAIVDVMMDTVGEGVRLTHRFRRDDRLKSMRIIMLTAVNQKLGLGINKENDEGYLPVDKFMEKPVDQGELLEEITRILKA